MSKQLSLWQSLQTKSLTFCVPEPEKFSRLFKYKSAKTILSSTFLVNAAIVLQIWGHRRCSYRVDTVDLRQFDDTFSWPYTFSSSVASYHSFIAAVIDSLSSFNRCFADFILLIRKRRLDGSRECITHRCWPSTIAIFKLSPVLKGKDEENCYLLLPTIPVMIYAEMILRQKWQGCSPKLFHWIMSSQL